MCTRADLIMYVKQGDVCPSCDSGWWDKTTEGCCAECNAIHNIEFAGYPSSQRAQLRPYRCVHRVRCDSCGGRGWFARPLDAQRFNNARANWAVVCCRNASGGTVRRTNG